MQAAAMAEHDRLQKELDRLRGREHELAEELGTVRGLLRELREQLSVINGLIHAEKEEEGLSAAELPDEESETQGPVTRLRGADIREAAAQLLARSPYGTAPIHYRDWFELLTAANYMPAGKDPLATFLTQLGRSPVVKRTTSAGMYVLDTEFPARAQAQLDKLRHELQHSYQAGETSDPQALEASRTRRGELQKSIEALERRLEEALRSLDGLAGEHDDDARAAA